MNKLSDEEQAILEGITLVFTKRFGETGVVPDSDEICSIDEDTVVREVVRHSSAKPEAVEDVIEVLVQYGTMRRKEGMLTFNQSDLPH